MVEALFSGDLHARELGAGQSAHECRCQSICSAEARVGVGSGINHESSCVQILIVAVMCKQLYWNWISTFTSGIRLEERQATDGRVLGRQATVPPQVHIFGFCALE